MKNLRIKIIIGFAIFAIVFFSIDWITKYFIFDGENVNWEDGRYVIDSEVDLQLIGYRSVAHGNSTIFSILNFVIPEWAHFIINSLIATIFALIPFFIKSLYLGISCGIIFGGVMGNSLDKIFSIFSDYYNDFGNRTFVRDIFYIPWLDGGTFNFADVAIILGSLMMIIYIITINIKQLKKT